MNKLLILFLSILISLTFVLAISITDNFNYPSPFVTSNSSQLFSYNISAPDGLSQIKWSWDNTNYSLYDNSLVLFYNFDNRSALGENDTHVKDLSMCGI